VLPIHGTSSAFTDGDTIYTNFVVLMLLCYKNNKWKLDNDIDLDCQFRKKLPIILTYTVRTLISFSPPAPQIFREKSHQMHWDHHRDASRLLPQATPLRHVTVRLHEAWDWRTVGKFELCHTKVAFLKSWAGPQRF
jgi:hypothetical protein